MSDTNDPRGSTRAVPVPETRNLRFMGSEKDRPTIYAKPSMGERKGLRQNAPAAATTSGVHAPISIDEVKDLRDMVITAGPLAENYFKKKGCPGITQDSFTKLAAFKTKLDNFLSTAKDGNTFPVVQDDLDLLKKIVECAKLAQNAPDPWAYVVLGLTVAGTVLAMHMSE